MNLDQLFKALQALYAKRGDLDKQILAAEKKYVEAAKLAAKASDQVKALKAKAPALKSAAGMLLKK